MIAHPDYALLGVRRELKSEWLPEVNKENPAFTDNAERLLFALDARWRRTTWSPH